MGQAGAACCVQKTWGANAESLHGARPQPAVIPAHIPCLCTGGDTPPAMERAQGAGPGPSSTRLAWVRPPSIRAARPSWLMPADGSGRPSPVPPPPPPLPPARFVPPPALLTPAPFLRRSAACASASASPSAPSRAACVGTASGSTTRSTAGGERGGACRRLSPAARCQPCQTLPADCPANPACMPCPAPTAGASAAAARAAPSTT